MEVLLGVTETDWSWCEQYREFVGGHGAVQEPRAAGACKRLEPGAVASWASQAAFLPPRCSLNRSHLPSVLAHLPPALRGRTQPSTALTLAL